MCNYTNSEDIEEKMAGEIAYSAELSQENITYLKMETYTIILAKIKSYQINKATDKLHFDIDDAILESDKFDLLKKAIKNVDSDKRSQSMSSNIVIVRNEVIKKLKEKYNLEIPSLFPYTIFIPVSKNRKLITKLHNCKPGKAS